MQRMKIYLVGGAVRDQLLGIPELERDWLVTGATPEVLLEQGFQQVGREFPVFLHPETKEEHALPRYGSDTTLDEVALVEADLVRRDLTINALALGPDGELIDPCGGKCDLENRILRHTPAFADDPIRVLRLARFASRFHAAGFRVAEETSVLVREMVDRGDLDNLVPERLWAEISRTLGQEHPRPFFERLREWDALAVLLPELDRLFGVPQPAHYHPEIDSGLHSLMVLDQACRLSRDPEVRFAALVHDLGKGTTRPEEWPSHTAHEERGAKLVEQLCRRLRIPNAWRDLALLTARYHTHCHRAFALKPGTLLRTLEALDAFRRPERFEQILLASEADVRGRTGFEQREYPQADFLREAREAAASVKADALIDAEDDGKKIAQKLRRSRQKAIAEVKDRYPVSVRNSY
jgi:tRNA nucleotidyltransferase (CCA-adding enzyme)